MKKHYYLAVLLCLFGQKLFAQGENNVWFFGRNYSIDFNTSPPNIRDTAYYGGSSVGIGPAHVWNYYRSIAVCGPDGKLRFIVKLGIGGANEYGPHIWDRNEKMIAGTDLMVGDQMGVCYPLVVPRPGNPNQYYIFVVRGNSLFYTLFDMSLNGGLGNIVYGQHNIQISGWGTVIGNRMTTVQGCEGTWLVVRSRMGNAYFSYKVGSSGIDTTAVVSECGLLPYGNYGGGLPIDEFIGSGDEYTSGGTDGLLRASPDGKLLVCGAVKGSIYNFPGGLELYDFEKCSGKVSSARLLQTNQWVYAGCFSPDSKRLYTTENDGPYYGGAGIYWYGRVYQYDLTQPSLTAIIASRTLLFQNPHYYVQQICQPDVQWLGDLRLAPDGKIYLLDQHPGECDMGQPNMSFHIIHQPNNLGSACMPQTEALYSSNNAMIRSNNLNELQREIVIPPPAPDTLPGQTYTINACFADSFVLSPSAGYQCYRWDNGTTERDRLVYEGGTYVVHQFTECKITTDTYRVSFATLPIISDTAAACPGELKISAANQTGDTTAYRYVLKNAGGLTAMDILSNQGMTANGLQQGNYVLNITSGDCTTALPITLNALPKPEVLTWPRDTTIYYGDSLVLHATGALLYVWWPVNPLDTAAKADPVAKPIKPEVFTVLGVNEYGCTDTGYVKVDIDYRMPSLVPNAFSPNGDGLNDVFKIEGIYYQKVVRFSVYNRLGQQVFHTIDGQSGWDGKYKGKLCDGGTYYYFIQLAFPNGELRDLKGDVILLR